MHVAILSSIKNLNQNVGIHFREYHNSPGAFSEIAFYTRSRRYCVRRPTPQGKGGNPVLETREVVPSAQATNDGGKNQQARQQGQGTAGAVRGPGGKRDTVSQKYKQLTITEMMLAGREAGGRFLPPEVRADRNRNDSPVCVQRSSKISGRENETSPSSQEVLPVSEEQGLRTEKEEEVLGDERISGGETKSLAIADAEHDEGRVLPETFDRALLEVSPSLRFQPPSSSVTTG